MENMLLNLIVISVGLMAGIYFAFSVVVMPALNRLPHEQGVRVMQIINRDILRSLFMPIFWFSSLLTLALLFITDLFGNWHLTLGSIIYLLGMFGVTACFNVPLNNQLQAATNDNQAQLWGRYLKHWCAWNHVRSICAFVALGLFVIGLRC